MALKLRPRFNKKLYLKIFIALTLSIAFTMIILSTVLYTNFERVALKQIYLANLKSLEQVNGEVLNMSKIASTISDQVYNDVSVSKLMYFSQPDVFDMSLAVKQLSGYRLSIPFISSIYVYNSKTQKFYAEPGSIMSVSNEETSGDNANDFYDRQIMDIVKNYKNYKPYKPIPRRFIYQDDESSQRCFYTFLVYDITSINRLNNAVVINISEDWVNRTIKKESDKGDGDTFIIDDKGLIVSDSRNYPMMADYSQKSYIKKIFRSNSGGYFVDQVNGVKSLVVYTGTDSFRWRSVRIISWNSIFEQFHNVRTVTVIIGIGILIFGVLTSFIISGRLYIPIGILLTNMEKLQFERRNNFKVLKNEFLRNIILGREISTKNDLLKTREELDIKMSFKEKICTLLFRIDRYNAFIQQNDNEDRNLYKYAIMNVACEMLSLRFKTEAVDMGKDMIVVILEADQLEDGELESELSPVLKSVQESVAQHLKLSVTITVSNTAGDISGINTLYNQAVEASMHRLFFGYGSIIFAQKVLQYGQKEYPSFIQKEKQFVDSIMGGKKCDTRRIYDEIINEVSEYPFIVYNHTISHLLFTLTNAMNVVKNNNSISDTSDSSILIMNLSDAEVIEEVNQKFYEYFDTLEAWLEDKKNSKYDNIISKINSIIETKYTESSLSIDGIAEALGMSAAHMCRLYKQHTFHTILEEIVSKRMDRARELLLSTELSIVDISEKAGFSNSNYFYKAFKTENGVTPNDFRKSNRQYSL